MSLNRPWVTGFNVTYRELTRERSSGRVPKLSGWLHVHSHDVDFEHEGDQMRNLYLNLFVKLQSLKNGDEGQDLVEYALLVALIALVCISGVNSIALAINTVFSNISSSLS